MWSFMLSSASSGCKLIINNLIFSSSWSLHRKTASAASDCWLFRRWLVTIIEATWWPQITVAGTVASCGLQHAPPIVQRCIAQGQAMFNGSGSQLKILVFVKTCVLKWEKTKTGLVVLYHLLKSGRVLRVFLIFQSVLCTNIGLRFLLSLFICFVENIRFPPCKLFQPSLPSLSTKNNLLELWFFQVFRKLQQEQMLFL